MDYYVYILYSSYLDVYYKGFTTNVDQRLTNHLNGKSIFASQVNDLIIVYKMGFETKREALSEEKRLKKLNRNSIERMIKC